MMCVSPSLEPDALAAALEEFQIVDVRYPNEWQAGHISGSVHIPLDYVYERTDELDRSRPVVTVCRSGSRSAQAAEELAGDGFDVQNLSGGIVAWADRGLPIVTDDGRPGRIAEPEPPVDDRPAELQQLQNDFMDAIFAVRDHFGDRDPSEEEVLAFLRERDQQGAQGGADTGPSTSTA
jgi:rhodanese-related sulfurtransferase